jgi:hypothetical protein
MTTIPGTNCAAALVALRLPSAAIVQALMMEVGLTHTEATNAAFTARDQLRDADRVSHANA